MDKSDSACTSGVLKSEVPDLEVETRSVKSAKSEKSVSKKENAIALKPWTQEWLWEIRGSLSVIMSTISLAIFTDMFVYSVVVPVVPYSFVSRMGVSEDVVQGKVSAALAVYSAGLIAGSFIFGYVSDKLKRRQTLMIIALLVIIGSTLILMLAKVMWLYFVGRLIQGLSASMVWTVGLAIIADTGDADNMAYLMSYPGIGMSLGMFLGPFIGGIVYEKIGYYPVFYICFGILSVDVALRLFMLEKSQLATFRNERAVQLSNADPDTLSPALIEYMTRYVHLVDESVSIKAKAKELQKEFGTYITIGGKRYRVPVMIALLKDTRVANAVLLGIALAWVMSAFESTMPLQLESLFGFNSMQVGLVFLAVAVPSFFEPLIGMLSDKYGSRYIISASFLLLVPPLILLRLPTKDTTGHIVLFVALIALIGTGLMAAMSPSMAEMTKAVCDLEKKHPGIYGKSKGFGQAYGLFNVGYSIGSLIAPFHAGKTREHAGWNTMTLSIAIICILISIISFFFAEENLITKYRNRSKGENSKSQV